MAESGKKKKLKSKTKTLSLNEFLSEGPNTSPQTLPPLRTTSWADETDDLQDDEISTHWPDEQKPKPRVDITTLPSAPRSSTAPNIDVSRLPKNPPFTVFIGNLSYEATEDDVRRFFERNQLQTASVRLVKDKDGRLKGFGYAEFDSVVDLMNALTLKGMALKGRQLQMDVAEGRNDGSGMGGDDRRRYRTDDDDRTAGNWRNTRDTSPPAPPSSTYSYGYHNRSPPPSRNYPDRGGYNSRQRGFRDRRDDSYQSERDHYPERRPSPRRYNSSPRRDSSPGKDNRSPSPPPRRSPSPSYEKDLPPRNRSLSPRKDQSPGRGPSPRRDYPNRGSSDQDRYQERDRYPERDHQDRYPERDRPPRDRDARFNGGDRFDMDRRRYDDRPPPSRGGNYRDDRRERDYIRDGRGDRGYRGGRRPFGDFSDTRVERPRDDFRGRGRSPTDRRDRRSPDRRREESPKERPKLQLQPRSKPIEDTNISDKAISIFGGARPVDTAKKEREIEERLKKKEAMIDDGKKRSSSSGIDDSEFIKKEIEVKEQDDKRSWRNEDTKPKERKDDTDRSRKGSYKDDEKPFKKDDNDIKKGRGKRGEGKPRDDDKKDGRGRGRGRGAVRPEKPSYVIMKKPEDQKQTDIEQTNRFAPLMDEEELV